MERSHPISGPSATPADINRNGRPTSIGTGGRHQSECPADIIGIRSQLREATFAGMGGKEGNAPRTALRGIVKQSPESILYRPSEPAVNRRLAVKRTFSRAF